MRHCSTRSPHLRERDPGPRSGRTGLSAVGLVGLGCALTLACVSPGTHEQLVAERDELAERVRLLGLANESLDVQVAQLVDEREDVLEERDALEARLAKSEDHEIELAKSLQSTTQELAVKTAALHEEASKVDDLQGTYDALVGDLESELAAGEIRIEQLRDGLELDVSQEILFASGSARLSEDGVAVLKTVASRLASLDYDITVEGHTDAVAIRGELKRRYPTNWDLAGARAASVVVLFVGTGIPGERLAAVSYGPYRPATEDDSPEGLALNRRIEIRLRPVESPPSPAAASGDAGS